ncbi:LuxR C-terminal-related transcriptional regulator [Streptomyces sp. 8N616]|uniref:LuxR C-terminal-related transcriptional regulator n=1 Tax=Streptomyces sp. 8N616 TaxID=3457414 RepID=UPI003FD0C19E
MSEEQTQRPLTLLLVDHHALFREGLAEICSAEDDLVVVGQTDTAESAVVAAAQEKPDVVVVDVSVPQPDPAWILRALGRAAPASRAIVFTEKEEPRLVTRVATAGARAYVLKNATRVEMLSVIRAVGNGRENVLFSGTPRALNNLHRPVDGLLSRRELEIIALVAQGMTSAQIAANLYISGGTVKRHLTNIYTKLGVASRIQAINKATALGLFPERVMSSYESGS